MIKYWAFAPAGIVADKCVRLHGGYGFMEPYPIARAYTDLRVSRIYAGTTEIMKEIIARMLPTPG
jgi:acyl-CoA dehydrogenase